MLTLALLVIEGEIINYIAINGPKEMLFNICNDSTEVSPDLMFLL